MLVLSRGLGEHVFFECPDGTVIDCKVVAVGKHIRLGITAPKNVRITRGELQDKPDSPVKDALVEHP